MRLSIGELAALSGVTVRALHHYDAIGLLKAAEISPANYRYYGDAEFARLQQILLLRALDFPLEQIKSILDAPGMDGREALEKQRALLNLRRERLDRLILLIDAKLKGEKIMNFEAFDDAKEKQLQNTYAQEAKARWGGTSAYQQSERREAARIPAQKDALKARTDDIFRAFADLNARKAASDGADAVALTRRWQAFITENYYSCDDEALSALKELYDSDERFKRYMDGFGAGTAAYVSAAIQATIGPGRKNP